MSKKMKPKHSSKNTPKSSPNITPTVSPAESLESPTRTPKKSSLEISPAKKETKNTNFEKRSAKDVKSLSPMPSFMVPDNADSPKDPVAFNVDDVVSSQRERAHEDPYVYMTPKKGNNFVGLLVTNLVFAFIVLVLIGTEVYLVKRFAYDYSEKVTMPAVKSVHHIIEQTCRASKELSDFKRMCTYVRDKYSSSCKWTYCSSVILTSVTTRVESALYGKSDFTMMMNTFKPVSDEYDEIASPEYTPCNSGSWCRNQVCETADIEGEETLQEYDALEPVDGGWKLFCTDSDVPCFEKYNMKDNWNNADSFGMMKCNKANCNDSGTLVPAHYVKFGMRACTNPLPRNGGKSCWHGRPNANDAVIAVEICGNCAGPTLELPSDCVRDNDVDKECTVICSGKQYFLPNSFNCTRHDKKHGFCFDGFCAEYLPGLSCFVLKDPHHHHH